MKEIKFRAWRHNQMIYDVTVGKVGNSYAQILLHWGAITPNYPEFEGFDRTSILMQYTGLKDKNGKEIYEGDIVTLHEVLGSHPETERDVDWIGKIEFQDACFWFQAKGRSENCWFHHNQEDIELIGNIYENPELIASDKHALTT